MSRKKNYQLPVSKSDAEELLPKHEEQQSSRAARIVFKDELPIDARLGSDARSINLDSWLDKGIDEWVWATVRALRAILRSGTRSTATVWGYGEGIGVFFSFLTMGRSRALVSEPGALSPVHVAQYAAWLQAECEANGWSAYAPKNRLSAAKSVIKQMMKLGVVEDALKRFFPGRLISSRSREESLQSALSDAELERLAGALKADLVDVHHGRLLLAPSEVMANRYLIVALRSGCNLTPLLELDRAALAPGLLPGTMLLRLKKHRGHKVLARMIRGNQFPIEEEGDSENLVVAMAEVAVIQRTLADTKDLVADAPTRIRTRAWLYRSSTGKTKGQVTCLSVESVRKAVQALLKRRNLKGDDGLPLRINTSRLRKTFAKRAFRISDGDMVVVSSMLGNSVKVAGLSYMTLDEQLKAEGAKFIEDDLVVQLRSGSKRASVITISRTNEIDGQSPEATPVSSCQNTLYGANAPKDGANHCDQFVMCLFCPSFAVVGELEDLWRLYSYQVFAEKQLQHLHPRSSVDESSVNRQMRKLYERAIQFIDEFPAKHFGEKLAARAKAKAQQGMHPFWSYQLSIAERQRNSVRGAGRT